MNETKGGIEGEIRPWGPSSSDPWSRPRNETGGFASSFSLPFPTAAAFRLVGHPETTNHESTASIFLSDVLTQGPHKKKGKKRRIVAILKCLFFPVCLFLVHRKRGTNRSKWKRNRERERNRKESTSSRSIRSMSLKFSAFLLNSGGIDDEIPFLPVLSIVYRVLPGFLICPYFYYGLT